MEHVFSLFTGIQLALVKVSRRVCSPQQKTSTNTTTQKKTILCPRRLRTRQRFSQGAIFVLAANNDLQADTRLPHGAVALHFSLIYARQYGDEELDRSGGWVPNDLLDNAAQIA